MIVKKGGGGNLIYFTVDAHYISRVGIRSWFKGGFFHSRSLNQADFLLLFCQLHERYIFFFRKFIHLFRSTSKDDFFFFLILPVPPGNLMVRPQVKAAFNFLSLVRSSNHFFQMLFFYNQNLLLLLNFAKDKKKKKKKRKTDFLFPFKIP